MFQVTNEIIGSYNIWKLREQKEEGHSIEAWINVSHGMNLCKLIVDEHILIDWDREKCEKLQSYGMPILYPTPNRVKNNKFVFKGRNYIMGMHGIIRFAPCSDLSCKMADDYISLMGKFDFSEGSNLYKLFPIASQLNITYSIKNTELNIEYEINNKSNEELPYGFALHPFFQKIGATFIKVKAASVMCMDEEKLPTGEVEQVQGTEYDLNNYCNVENLNLDHVYVDGNQKPEASIWYKDIKLCVHIVTTTAFSHLVVYTPKKQKFFCIESQSCSTNAHNLYGEGFEVLSGLEIIKPKEKIKGKVRYTFDYKF